jgi:hypothetical protein
VNDQELIDLLRQADQRTGLEGDIELQHVLRGGEHRPRRRRAIRSGALTAAAVAVAATLMFGPTLLGGTDRAAPAMAIEQLSLLSAPASAQDRLPAEVDQPDGGAGDIVRSSVRLVGETTAARFWAGVDSAGQVCLIAYLTPPDWVAGISCAPVSDFAHHGLWVAVQRGSEGELRGHLLPDGYAESKPAPDGLHFVTPNLAVSSRLAG